MKIFHFLQINPLSKLQELFIKIKPHPTYANLHFLKYDQIETPRDHPLAQQCRGIILDADDNWRPISYPYNRFFNYGEILASEIDWRTAKIYEKLDGSMMTVYWYDGKWHVASNGHPSAGGPVNNKPYTFEELFWSTWDRLGYELPQDTNICYMFELMTPENVVVVQHKDYNIILHGARNLQTYQELDPEVIAITNKWKYVHRHDLGTSQAEKVINAANELNGFQSEGFVVCDQSFNRIKIKAEDYLRKHRLRSTITPASLLDVVRQGEQSEVLSYFPELTNQIKVLTENYTDLVHSAYKAYDEFKEIETQKDFALAIKHLPYSGALFSMRANKISSIEEWFKSARLETLLLLVKTP